MLFKATFIQIYLTLKKRNDICREPGIAAQQDFFIWHFFEEFSFNPSYLLPYPRTIFLCLIFAGYTMYRNGNFGLVFGRGEILLTYMICTPLDFLGIKDLQKNRKRPIFFFKGHRQGHSYTN